MGEYFITTNQTRRQCITHWRLPYNSKFSGLLSGIQGPALGLLVADLAPAQRPHPLIGAWAGDPVVVAGDEQAEPNLYHMALTMIEAGTFDDLTFFAVAMLCTYQPAWAQELVQNIGAGNLRDNELLVDLADTAIYLDCHPLREALHQIIGADWRQQYDHLSARHRPSDHGRRGMRLRDRIADTPQSDRLPTPPASARDDLDPQPPRTPILIVNPTKRQYLDTGQIRVGTTHPGLLEGVAAFILGLMLTDTRSPRGYAGPLFRAWLGDPILAAYRHAAPNPVGITTATRSSPERNLYQMAQAEFDDLSCPSMLALCQQWEHAQEFATAAQTDQQLLVTLGAMVFHDHCEALQGALEEAIGEHWEQAYHKARAESGGAAQA